MAAKTRSGKRCTWASKSRSPSGTRAPSGSSRSGDLCIASAHSARSLIVRPSGGPEQLAQGRLVEAAEEDAAVAHRGRAQGAFAAEEELEQLVVRGLGGLEAMDLAAAGGDDLL